MKSIIILLTITFLFNYVSANSDWWKHDNWWESDYEKGDSDESCDDSWKEDPEYHDKDTTWWNKDWKTDPHLYGDKNSTEKECIHGEYRCTTTSSDRCNFGKWISNICPIGTKCLGCNDFECVHDFDYDRLKAQLCVNNQTDCETRNTFPHKKEEEKPKKTECSHGDFRCTKTATERCDHGVWFSYPCVNGTRCIGCGDW